MALESTQMKLDLSVGHCLGLRCWMEMWRDQNGQTSLRLSSPFTSPCTSRIVISENARSNNSSMLRPVQTQRPSLIRFVARHSVTSMQFLWKWSVLHALVYDWILGLQSKLSFIWRWQNEHDVQHEVPDGLICDDRLILVVIKHRLSSACDT